MFNFYTGMPHIKFLTSDMHSAEAVILKLHVKLAPGWALIHVNFDPLVEIGYKVEGGYSFARLQLEGQAKVLNIWVSSCFNRDRLPTEITIKQYMYECLCSLSKPYTSVTALHMCVHACLFAWTDHLPWVTNELIQICLSTIAHSNGTSTKPWEWEWRPTARQ